MENSALANTSTELNFGSLCVRRQLHTCACRNAVKKCASGEDGTLDEITPFKNSPACEPVTDKTLLCGIGAMVGVFRTSERRAGGIGIIVVAVDG